MKSVTKKYSYLLMIFLFTQQASAQDWKIFNDTLNYYYSASNTGDQFTLRTKQVEFTETDSVIWFTDNFIPVDTLGDYFFNENGSVWGDSVRFSGDSIWFEGARLFINNQTVGSTWDWSYGLAITLEYAVDTLILGEPDSIRFYLISDGTHLIQSKNYGWVDFPSFVSETDFTYKLDGIEYLIGQQFDSYNLLFDFEVGDVLVYQEHYYHFDGDDWEEEYIQYHHVPLYSKTLIDGHYFYQDFPLYFPFTPDSLQIFNFPGERVDNLRLGGFFEYEFDLSHSQVDDQGCFQNQVGWRRDTSGIGAHIEYVGLSGIYVDDYATFGEIWGGWGDVTDLNYYGTEICEVTPWGGVWCTYEEEFGLTHYYEEGVESYYRIDLLGAIKSGDTLGSFYELDLSENTIPLIKFYPNPSN
ncbi:MAG: hypothetical protein ACI8ZM_005560 [Crocinitomix sp.]|jgi:hypothetical protein